ncbi:uncharacterized protein LOC131664334 isoform X2 [Phymastichus coffea]|uniref:uncharacterized protein LOC131664334 isoform X2 n=1 Tax=Phymastichus coffea TaxID=108790 RepID=UPI00273B8270|nr:uncharacterized protein LOC131664334 isoform X2 [Phymastichus coffea]
MTYGTSFNHASSFDKERGGGLARPCNASAEDAGPTPNGISATAGNGGRLRAKLTCPAMLSRLRVEKIEGGLMVAGVVVAANCQLALPAFGFLFVLVGAVLTAASYRGPGEDEDKDSYAARIAFTGNSRVLGPICICVGALMLALGALLCALTRRARRRERRVGFHCPLHGDFYPLSPAHGAKMMGKHANGWTKIPCLRGARGSPQRTAGGKLANPRLGPPQCPHSALSSTRSSLSSSPLSPCPTPMPFLVTSGSMSGMQIGAGGNLSPDQTFGSIRSLSVSREVASFPLSRTPTPPTQHRPLSGSLPKLSEEAISSSDPSSPTKPEANAVPAPQRKSVSIVLPDEPLG